MHLYQHRFKTGYKNDSLYSKKFAKLDHEFSEKIMLSIIDLNTLTWSRYHVIFLRPSMPIIKECKDIKLRKTLGRLGKV